MKQSQLFTKTRKEIASDETSINAQLLLKAGYIDKVMAGVYTYLPLGLKVLKKINNVIREEINAIGGQELLMPALSPKELWKTTGRWDNFDALFKFEAHNHEYALAATHEELITPLLQKFVFSYKDLPQAVYQFQNKFRNEARAKSGILRGREFLMKDLYSFHTSEEDLEVYYKKAEKAYEKIWFRLGIGDITVKTYASGGAFSKYSHEYQTFSEVGEDTIYYCPKCNIALNSEIIEEQNNACPECGESNLEEKKAIEVGNIFKLKTKFTDAFKFKFTNQEGEQKPVIMGCYGIGPSRLMGTLVEIFNDNNGIIWPKEIAPFQVHIVILKDKDETINEKIQSKANKLYEDLNTAGFEVLLDDRLNTSNGEKLKDSDLLGLPMRLLLSAKTLQAESIELKLRTDDNSELLEINDELLKNLKEKLENYGI